MATLHIEGVAQTLEIKPGQSLLDVIVESAVPIATSCGGVAACGLCRLTVLEGMELLRALAPREEEHLGNLLVERGMRLACQARLVSEGELRVKIPAVDDIARRKQEKMTRMVREQRAQRRAEQEAKRQARDQQRRGGSPGVPGLAQPRSAGTQDGADSGAGGGRRRRRRRR